MRFDLSTVKHSVGHSIDIDYVFQLEDLFISESFSSSEGVRIQGRLFNLYGDVYVSGNVYMKYCDECSRCLIPISDVLSFSFEHKVVDMASDEEPDAVVARDDFDLNDIVKDDIILFFPSKLLCGEDCKGLCSMCGVNLNQTTCSCS